MKYLLIALLSLSTIALSSETPPDYLKDGTITVTLSSGKTYTFSANEFAVIPRKKKVRTSIIARKERVEKVKRIRHIISGEIVSSFDGRLNTSINSSSVNVRGNRDIGVGIMYQYNLFKDFFLGGRVDTNGGGAVNVGVGY